MTAQIPRLVIVGVGLIGGSFALDLKRLGLVAEVVGVGRAGSDSGSSGQANLQLAKQRGLIDVIGDNLADAVSNADLVVLSMPVGAMPAVFSALAPVLSPHCLVTDVGSTKQDVIATARAALGRKIGQFVPGHPIAGAENSGAAAARLGLFESKPLILTPLPENHARDIARVAALWGACGAQVATMTAAEHDTIFAAVSHLPHLAAFALMDELISRADGETYLRYAGAGFRDFTRIAASHPEMWRDISLANRDAVVTELDAYLRKLTEIRNLVANHDGTALQALFERAQSARKNWHVKTGTKHHD